MNAMLSDCAMKFISLSAFLYARKIQFISSQTTRIITQLIEIMQIDIRLAVSTFHIARRLATALW